MSSSVSLVSLKNIYNLWVKLFHTWKYGWFSLSEVFHFSGEGGDPGTVPRKLHSREPEFLLAGILGTGVPSSGDPEADVLPGASPRQDIAPVILRSRGKLWAYDDVLETVESRALMFPEEELGVFWSAFKTKKGTGFDEASKSALSRGVLLVARENLPRVYYPSFCFLSPSGFPIFLFSLLLCGLHSLKLSSPFSGQRSRDRVPVLQKMDSSGSSLDLTAEVENLSREVVELAPPSAEIGEFPPVV
ncbi:hypothetical protein F2Q70_00011353 [Brassica cretica]|uniref:Uncharacterized protein n=1 Tax=Brassica cretica TaxID=69181 RepID=A0A8S9M619_BRACR|nr:hypothetical protein F2Q70_00011353 [Brassica cretica]